jgi:hypothetical protein
LLLAAQVVGRQVRLGAADVTTLRALGGTRSMTTLDGLPGIVAAIALGSLLAAVTAVALSPLAPIGVVRSVDPHAGIEPDWTVLALGVGGLVVGLGALATWMSWREARRAAHMVPATPRRLSRVARLADASGLPAPALTGIRFVLEPSSVADAAPVRSAMLGTAVAVIVVSATVTFGASLHTLVTRPPLYGWNWDDELVSAYGGISNIPERQADRLLHGDPHVASWSGAYFPDSFHIDGRTVAVMGVRPGAKVTPAVLSGHAVRSARQVVLGATTLSDLHKRVGDTVVLTSTFTGPKRLTVVGTAALPAIGVLTGLHLELGTGAVLSDTLVPTTAKGFGSHDGPQAIFVRFHEGASRTASVRSLRRDAAAMETTDDGRASVVAVQRPAEIVNYRTMGSTPVLLGAALAAAAVAALALTLVATVHRRRRDLALLKTLGFTGRQLRAVVASQATVAVAVGTLVGIPLGIGLGRTLWVLFARQVHVVPDPVTPVGTIAVLAVSALVLANLVAALPGRIAARTRMTVLLRAE